MRGCDPIFDAIGSKTLWLGPAGNGTRLKLVLNNWLASQVEAVAETIALTEALGRRPDVFVDDDRRRTAGVAVRGRQGHGR